MTQVVNTVDNQQSISERDYVVEKLKEGYSLDFIKKFNENFTKRENIEIPDELVEWYLKIPGGLLRHYQEIDTKGLEMADISQEEIDMTFQSIDYLNNNFVLKADLIKSFSQETFDKMKEYFEQDLIEYNEWIRQIPTIVIKWYKQYFSIIMEQFHKFPKEVSCGLRAAWGLKAI
jgi:hypothetical protein